MADQATGAEQATPGDGGEPPCRALVTALGVDLQRLQPSERAAMEALAAEVIALREDRAELARRLETAELMADRDTLCPVFNRRAFERELTREIALAERYQTPLCLLFLDLDRFKQVNDLFGHATGDTVIAHVAATLLENVRQTDIVGRMGGDEFAIALTHAELRDSEAKAGALDALISGLTVRFRSNAQAPAVTLGASIGLVQWHRGLDAKALIARADEAMFRTKAARKSGR